MDDINNNMPHGDVENVDSDSRHQSLSVPIIISLVALVGIALSIVFLVFSQTMDAPGGGAVDVADSEIIPVNEAEEARIQSELANYDTSVIALFNIEPIGHYFGRASDGKSLYVYQEGECETECNEFMEPYITTEPYDPLNESEVARQLSTVQLPSGELQYTWKGQKLFTYKADVLPNDVLGDGLDNSWILARP
jgi:hypothetical protein